MVSHMESAELIEMLVVLRNQALDEQILRQSNSALTCNKIRGWVMTRSYATVIGVNSYWAQGLKPPPHFYDHGARLYDEPPTFVT